MAAIRQEFINIALKRAVALTEPSINRDVTKKYEFQKQTILDDKSLTIDEKTEAISVLTKDYNYYKILLNEGTKRLCENCSLKCFAISYCEHCVRTYLKNKFSNWTSGNNDIDKLIQNCQLESFLPDKIIEWISYNNLKDIKYMTKGGCSEIYLANWVDGPYDKWDSKDQQLKRRGAFKVILKKLENVENANRSWFEEAKSHLILSNKYTNFVKCHGLTRDPSDGNYMLVMRLMNTDLRKYLQRQQTWKEKIYIVYRIIYALHKIHKDNLIHRDLHSGNILYLQFNNIWYISDFGFCGPADKPLKSIYGNLPYIAPEALVGKEYTFASDIYSFGILMWEISSGRLPFNNYEHDYNLAMKIINGIRPKVISGTPLEYKKLMEQCWDADPLKRPNASTLLDELEKMWKDSYNDNNINTLEQNNNNSSQISQTNLNSSSKLYSLSTSKLYQFENLPEPKNATEGEQEEFHSKPYDFDIPDNIEDYNLQEELSENAIKDLKG